MAKPSQDTVIQDDYPALELFRGWLSKGNTQAAVARALGIRPPSVHAWVEGASRPQHHLRRPLEVLTGGEVPESAWLRPSEKEAQEQALRKIHSEGSGLVNGPPPEGAA